MTAKAKEKPTLTKSFFKTNITIPITIREHKAADSGMEVIEHKVSFELRRQNQAEADELQRQSMLEEVTEPMLRVKRLAMLLVEVKGLGDFPDDKRPMTERAFEYFNDEDVADVVRTVMLFYDRSLLPAELFRGF